MKEIIIAGERLGDDQLVDSYAAARMLGLSRRTVQGMTSKRLLPIYKIGSRVVRYKVRDLRIWIEKHAIKPQVVDPERREAEAQG